MNTGLKDNVISEIIDFAVKYGVHKVVLFGSRARGDYSRSSDIDLAILGGDVTRFTLAMEEDVNTLLTFDVIELTNCTSKDLLDSIQKEGVVLYEEI